MYETQTYELILQRSLDRVGSDVDKREGSVIMNAIAPVSAEHANIYILLDGLIRDGYGDTASREYLIKRCKERGITPYPATYAVLKGKFNMEVPIGSRFNLGEVNYAVTTYIGSEREDGTLYYYYQLKCETLGSEGNKYFGELSSIDYIHKDLEGWLVELLIPADDEEDTEVLRKRYLNSFREHAYGGNRADYREKTNSLDGVGGTVVVPVWNGGGTVKLIIIDSTYSPASPTLVAAVQEAMDPPPQGTGLGIAPIGHTVTVVSADRYDVSVTCNVVLAAGYLLADVRPNIQKAVEEYILSLRKNWENENLTIRIAQIENRILDVEGVLDIVNTAINGVTHNIPLTSNQLPMFKSLGVN